MFSRCFRSVPLDRVSSTAEQSVLERLSALHCATGSSSASSSASSIQHSGNTPTSNNGSSSGSGLFSPLSNPDSNTATVQERHTLYAGTGSSNGGSCFDQWWVPADWDSGSCSSSSSSSGLADSSSSSSSSSDSSSTYTPDIQCDIGSYANSNSSPVAASNWVTGSQPPTGSTANRLQCDPWQAQQPTPHQQQQQEKATDSIGIESNVTKGWGWPWTACSSSSRGTISSTDCNISSSVSSTVSSSPTNVASSSSKTDGSAVLPGSLMSGTASLWHEGGLAAAAGAASQVTLHPAAQAYLQGNLGVAFSGGGFRYVYFVGVMDVLLHRLGIIGPSTPLSGASSGSLIAVFTKCGLPVEQVLQLTQEFSQDCAANGVKGRLGVVLRAYLEAYLPQDAHTLCDGVTFLAVTKVWPFIRTSLLSSFPTRCDLINAVLASCHLPTLSDGSLTMSFKGGSRPRGLHIDGGLLSVLTPPPSTGHTVLVCSMPSAQIARLPPFITRPQQCEIAISPDTFNTWPFSRRETTALALQPPSLEFIEHMVERGRADALAWAEAVGFLRNGQRVFPTAQHLNALRQQQRQQQQQSEHMLMEPVWAAGC